ncbi:hypothetical protein [Paenibacillus mucilaginosus]|uniref:Uncharacterized protein n=2 Tax=Paenibacillus mucilaginosus TaxID=61624 RepID=F8F5A1_PAEMK|nr:hypothetical protein [Paenibacillus mucilaginosus]AEI40912.1 hypothetical protein KNP414_02351 [Paenibacillus mucilaginosus KNP414]MCG7211630.1 hypothetical protein [Paenibacillus mucilaginosus]WDM30011.1 hypothetical protein KCX80_13045 [Paenibacillus mucilaginosus]
MSGKGPERKMEVIEKLREMGEEEAAKRLDEWRNDRDENRGWDSWFVTEFPDLAEEAGVDLVPIQDRPERKNK